MACFPVMTRGKRKSADSADRNGTTGRRSKFYRKKGSLFRVLTRSGTAKKQQVFGGKAFEQAAEIHSDLLQRGRSHNGDHHPQHGFEEAAEAFCGGISGALSDHGNRRRQNELRDRQAPLQPAADEALLSGAAGSSQNHRTENRNPHPLTRRRQLVS